jgi:hypothetical protein
MTEQQRKLALAFLETTGNLPSNPDNVSNMWLAGMLMRSASDLMQKESEKWRQGK